MTTIALFGAGGKMGCRITDNLVKTDHRVLHIEPSESGRKRLAERGVEAIAPDVALASAEVVILAVPDNRIKTVAEAIVEDLQPGATVIVLDAAAPFAGHLPAREDISYIACHPCHPPLFSDEVTPEAQRDYFGAIAAKQNAVCALIQGSEDDYDRAAGIVADIFAPVMTVFRVTLDNMVLLEPVLAETTAATCVTIIREATDEAVRRGVPADAARAFILGHVRIELAILFDELGTPFSDGALKAIEAARSEIFQPDWKRVFEPENVRRSIDAIVAH